MQVRLTVVQGKGPPREMQLEAPSLDEARRSAERMGCAVLSCRKAAWARNDGGRPSSARFDVALFVEQLRDLVVAGLSVTEALNALGRGARADAAQVIGRLDRQLQEGKTLSEALESEAAFPAMLVALVRASELTSELPDTLGRYLEHDRRVKEVRHRLWSTAIYPVLLTVVGTAVLLFLLFYVMPRFARVFEGMTGDLPWSARAMVAWSQWLNENGRVASAALVLLAVAVTLTGSSKALRARWARAALAWKPLHERLTTYYLAQWYRATGLLVQGGIPLPQALGLSRSLLPIPLQPGSTAVLQGVTEGLSPSAAHVRAGMATPVAEQLLLAGERTGDLGDVLMRIAHFHEVEVSRGLERLMRTLEPVVMVFIGLGVGLVVVLMYLPIFELASAIQ